MIKALIFDLDDTLYDCITENENAVESTVRYVADELLHMDRETVMSAFCEGRDTIKRQLSGWDIAAQHNRVLYFQKMLEILGVKPFGYATDIYAHFWNDFLGRISLFPGAADFLDEMRNRGLKIGVCTDMTAHIQFRKIDRLGLTDRLDAMMTSEEAGAEKPDGKIFAMAADKLGVRPEEVIYVGDSYGKDVVGAQMAGMTPVWYLSHDKREKSGWYQAADYEELATVVDEIMKATDLAAATDNYIAVGVCHNLR